MSEREHPRDDQVEDLDPGQSEAEDVTGGADYQLGGPHYASFEFLKVDPSAKPIQKVSPQQF
jgi:hypothetical protein